MGMKEGFVWSCGFFMVLLFFFLLCIPNVLGVGPGQYKFIVIEAYTEGSNRNLLNGQILDLMTGKGDEGWDDSVSEFWNRNSYGQIEIVGLDGGEFDENDIYGPFEIGSFVPLGGNCVREIVDRVYEASRGVVNYYDGSKVVLFTDNSCGTAGVTTRRNYGSDEEPLWISFAIHYLSGAVRTIFKESRKTFVHEAGHVLGGSHSQYVSCFPDSSLKPEECKDVFIDRGDPYDIMGGDGHPNEETEFFGHSNAAILDRMGLLDGRLIEVESEGKYSLNPIGSQENGVKALKFRHGTLDRGYEKVEKHLYVEWHQPVGLDENIADIQSSNIFEGVLIHITEPVPFLIQPFVVGEWCNSRSDCPRVLRSALPYGESYTDPNTGMRLRVGEPQGDKLEIIVEEMGRTDFTPPEIISVNKVVQDDICEGEISIDAEDVDSGISRVEIYCGSDLSEENLIEEIFSPDEFKFGLEYPLCPQYFIRVYDDASSQGGIEEDNYVRKMIEIDDRSCMLFTPTIDLTVAGVNYKGGGEAVRSFELTHNDFGFIGSFESPFPLSLKVDVINGELGGIEVVAYFEGNQISGISPLGVVGPTGTNHYEITEEYFLEPGFYQLGVNVVASGGSIGVVSNALIEIIPSLSFKRGDFDQSGRVNIGDAIASLNYLFAGADASVCMDAADVNDDGIVNIVDPISLLGYLFNGEPSELPLPGAKDEGLDGTYDELSCDKVGRHAECRENACVLVEGEGEDGCAASSDCCFDGDKTEEYPFGYNPFLQSGADECGPVDIVLEEGCGGRVSIYCVSYGSDYICKEGRCVSVSELCEDSDRGDRYNKGFIMVDGEQIFDVCDEERENVLIERKCTSRGDPRDVRESCTYGCVDGACVKVTCESDSDGGLNIYEKGEVVLSNGDVRVDECDGFDSTDGVYEAQCKGGELFISHERCNHGCVDGACVKVTCESDSDGGLNIYEKGEVVLSNGDVRVDECKDFGFGWFVLEGQCGDEGFVASWEKCENGCEDGACVA